MHMMMQMQAGAGGGKYVMRDLMRVLEQEKHAYTDPVTEVNPNHLILEFGLRIPSNHCIRYLILL